MRKVPPGPPVAKVRGRYRPAPGGASAGRSGGGRSAGRSSDPAGRRGGAGGWRGGPGPAVLRQSWIPGAAGERPGGALGLKPQGKTGQCERPRFASPPGWGFVSPPKTCCAARTGPALSPRKKASTLQPRPSPSRCRRRPPSTCLFSLVCFGDCPGLGLLFPSCGASSSLRPARPPGVSEQAARGAGLSFAARLRRAAPDPARAALIGTSRYISFTIQFTFFKLRMNNAVAFERRVAVMGQE